ncbi:MAG: GTP-binding protein [Candidatus Saliniplasma sp.]
MSKFTKRKINLLGDTSVGKTSLTIRYVKNIFGGQYLKTIGTNVYTKQIEIDDGTLKLVIHDIMGEKDYTAVQEGAFQNSNGAIAVADMTDENTLYSLVDYWLPRYHEIAGPEKPVALAVNKSDLQERQVTTEKIKSLKENFDSYAYTSAKMDLYVEKLFEDIGKRSLDTEAHRKKDIKNIVMNHDISSPNELVNAALALSSEMRLMPYKIREDILEDSFINKFALEDEIPESRALFFVSSLSNWYQSRADELDDKEKIEHKKGANVFLKLIRRYYEKSSISP